MNPGGVRIRVIRAIRVIRVIRVIHGYNSRRGQPHVPDALAGHSRLQERGEPPAAARRARGVRRTVRGHDLEVVFVVDGSPDGSLRILQERLPSWRVRDAARRAQSRNFGSFAAIAAGLQQGRGDYFAVISADLQEPPELVRRVPPPDGRRRGRRRVRSPHRPRRSARVARAVARCFWRLYRRFVVPDMPKGGVDMFGCTRQVRDHVVAMREVNTNLIALLFWLGFRRAFVPYERRARLEGRSAWTFGRKLRYALDSVFNFTDLPIRALLAARHRRHGVRDRRRASPCSSGWYTGRVPVLGYTPLMLVITFFGGLTALGLGIIGPVPVAVAAERAQPAELRRARPRTPSTAGAPERALRSDRRQELVVVADVVGRIVGLRREHQEHRVGGVTGTGPPRPAAAGTARGSGSSSTISSPSSPSSTTTVTEPRTQTRNCWQRRCACSPRTSLPGTSKTMK